MKKNALVQLILIYVGVSSLYLASYSVIQQAYLLFTDSRGYQANFVTHFLISYLLVGIFGVIFIAKSGNISSFIASRSGLDASLSVYTKPQQLLSILIVVTALAHLLDYLPPFANNLLKLFDSHTTYTQSDGPLDASPELILNLIQIVFPCLMIIFARNLTRYFAKNIMLDDEDIIVHNDTVELEAPADGDDEV